MDEVRGTPFAVAAVTPVRNNTSTSPIAFPMSETPTPEVRVNESAGHLSFHVEGAHPDRDPVSLRAAAEANSLCARRLARCRTSSLPCIIVFGVRYGAARTVTPALLPDQPNTNIIWLSQPGPGGGGGGGGNRMKDPPRQAEMPGKDKITVPVSKPPKMEMQEVKKEPDPVAQLNIPAKSLAAAQDSLPGAIEAPPGPPTLSQGSGSGGGAGTGTGTRRRPRHRFGSRSWQWRRHRRRRLSSRQRRHASARAARRASAVHLGRDARQGSGHRAARVRGQAGRQRRRRAGDSLARPDVRPRPAGSQRRHASGASRPAPGSASRSPCSSRSS